MEKKRLRVVLLYSAGHIGSSIVLNRLYKMKEVEIVGVVRSEPVAFSIKNFKRTSDKLKKIGIKFGFLLLWQRFIQFIGFYVIAPIFAKDHLMAAWQFAKRHNITSFQTSNINDEDSKIFIKTLAPDLVISAYFSQILKKEVIEIPAIGVLNIHPALLPDYKGAMNYFWVLKNVENKAGVSIHWIDEGIDTGEIIAKKSFSLKSHYTQQQVLEKTAFIGACLLRKVLKNLLNGKENPVLPRMEYSGNYYPMPKSDDFNDYFARRRFFRIRDIIHLVLKKH